MCGGEPFNIYITKIMRDGEHSDIPVTKAEEIDLFIHASRRHNWNISTTKIGKDLGGASHEIRNSLYSALDDYPRINKY